MANYEQQGYEEEKTTTHVVEGNGHAVTETEPGRAPPARTEERGARPSFMTRGERALGAASGTEAFVGAGVVVLAILGLAGVFSEVLLSIACIAAGFGLLMAGSAEGTRARALHGAVRKQLIGGVSAETLGGVGAVVLGILGLIGLGRLTLTSIAVIALGGALLFGSVVPAHERELITDGGRMVERAGQGAGAVQGLLGIGSVVLGILGLVGVSTLTLLLVGMLAVGAAQVLTGTAFLGGEALAHAR